MQDIKHVLVIEDNPPAINQLRNQLDKCLSPEILVIQGPGGLKKLPGSYHPDLIFLELNNPDNNGLRTLRAINKNSPDVPIIVVGNVQDPDMALKTIQAGAQDFLLTGDFDEKSLVKTIRYSIERKRNQLKLQESEERYRALVENAPEALVVLDVASQKFISVSESAVKLFKFSKEELMKLGPVDLSPAFQQDGRPSGEAVVEKLNDAINGEKPTFEWIHLDGEGNLIPCEVRLVRLPSEGNILIRGSITDISERKENDAALRAVEETRKLIMNSALDAVICMDTRGLITFWTAQAEKIFGWTAEEVIGRPVAETIIPPGLREQHWRGMQRYLKTGGGPVLNKLVEITALHKNGKEFPVELTIAPIKQGITNFFCAFIRDITESIKARQALKESEERYRSVIEQASDAIMITDQVGNFLEVNSSFCKKFGYTKEELSKMNVTAVIDPQQLETDPIRFDILAKGEHIFRVRRMMHKNGTIIEVEANIKMLPDGRIMAIARDITQRKKAEVELMKVHDRLRHISHATNDAVWDHDLRTGEIWWNDKLYELYGMDSREVPGGFDAWTERLHPDDRERVIAKLLLTQEEKRTSWQDEYRFRLPDGSYAHMYDRNYYTYEDGQLIRKSGSNLDITALKKAEDTLVNNELRFRTLTSNAPVGIFQTDTKGMTIYVNETWMEITGLRYEAAMGLGWVAALHPEERDELVRGWNESSVQALSSSTDYRFIDKDGNIRWVSGNAVPLYNKNGEFSGHIGTLTDISERKKAEAALRESEEKYRTLVEQAGDAIAIFDMQGRILDVNYGATQLLGYTKDELRKLTLKEVLTPEELINSPVRYDILQSGEGTIRQRKMIRKDGAIVQTEVHAKRLTNGNFLALIRDLSERIKAQDQIEREKKLAESIIESLPGLFYLFDDQCRYIRWNKLKETISGYTGEEISRMSPLDFFEDEEKELVRERILEGFKSGETTVEAHLVTKTGKKIPYYFTGIALEYEGRSCLLGTGIDISDRKKGEDILRESSEQLRQLSAHLQNIREEERIDIAREIHDELGQQLTVLKMDISWLKKKIPVKEKNVEQKMKDLMEMIDNTVKTVRKISSDLRPSMLDDLGLVAALEWHSQEFEKRSGIKTTFNTTVQELHLPVDTATAMFRIFQESLTNVARHADASDVKASLDIKKGQLKMQISDNGKGFSVNGIQNKKTLGILGMRERVYLMNGDYSIESSPGKGTLVKVAIPVEINHST